MENICAQITVKGLVQGVYFRAECQKQARNLNLFGYAKNMEDGSVEILACGGKAAVEELYIWSKKGSELSKVESSQITYCDYSGKMSDFEVK